MVVALGFDGGRRRVGEVSVDRAIAVVHGADEAARAALLLALALEAAAVSGLMAVGVAVARAIAETRAGLVAEVVLGARTITVAKLLLPSFGGWARTGLLLGFACLEVLRLATGGQDLLACLQVSNKLAGGVLAGELGTLLEGVRRLVLALAAAASAALGLPHAVLDAVRIRRAVLIHLGGAVLIHLAIHLGGR